LRSWSPAHGSERKKDLDNRPARPHLGSMLYLIAVFCSPLALLLTGKPISALFNLLLYIFSIVLWVTLLFWHAALLLSPLAFLHAVFAIHDTRVDRRAGRVIPSMRRQ